MSHAEVKAVGRIKLVSSVLALGGILLGTTVASAQTRGFGVVNGEVKAESGEQVGGVSVKFMLPVGEPIQALVAKDGKWRAVGIGKGQWRVMVAAPGYAAKVVTISVDKETFGTDPIVTVLRKDSTKDSAKDPAKK